MSALKKAGTSNGRNARGSDFELSSEVIRNRRGTSSTNKWGESSTRNRLPTHEDDLITSSAKYPNDIAGSNSVMTSEFPPSEVKREKSWEDMREEMKNAASFKSKQTVKSGVGSNSMMTSEPPASEWEREESWEDILENMNNAASLNLKGTVKSGAAQPKYREQNVVTSPSMLKPQRKDGQDQRRKTAQRTSQRTLSSSNLSSRVTPPRSTTAQKSLPFQGSSPSNLKKAVNGKSLEGNSTAANRRRAVKNLEEPEMAFENDFVRRDLNDVNEFMARNKGSGGGGTSSSKTTYGRNRQPPSERRQNDGDGVRNLRRHRIMANFDGGEQGIARDNRETRMQRCHNNREANQVVQGP
ncbi:hypothetical protein BSL78_02492 [Apostichopus japonicus]|uniref:Uncharacterized protein n=1 Tax=Stichopus japonicus TaxID=307972 RepID=A0A2G8LJW8_STIJA|nr:hypothetical protein BSL78_02492 [Apostichopus japonicus]